MHSFNIFLLSVVIIKLLMFLSTRFIYFLFYFLNELNFPFIWILVLHGWIIICENLQDVGNRESKYVSLQFSKSEYLYFSICLKCRQSFISFPVFFFFINLVAYLLSLRFHLVSFYCVVLFDLSFLRFCTTVSLFKNCRLFHVN